MHTDGYMHQGSKLFLQGLSEMQLALWVGKGKPENPCELIVYSVFISCGL